MENLHFYWLVINSFYRHDPVRYFDISLTRGNLQAGSFFVRLPGLPPLPFQVNEKTWGLRLT